MTRLRTLSFLVLFPLLTGCLPVTDPLAESYTLSASVTGDAGTGVSVTLTDEGSGTGLGSIGPTTILPAVAEYTGTYSAGVLSTTSVSVDVTGVPVSGSVDIVVTLVDASYEPPVTRTLDEYTLTNGGSAAADLSYLKLFTLPPN